jgi:glycoside/pentoside/hexuronide:cation symporter, GPH family
VLVAKFAGPHTPEQPQGDVARGWQITFGVYAALCVVCFLITFATTRERIKPAVMQTSLRTDLRDLLKNSPWGVLFFMTLVHFGILSFRGGAEYHYYMSYADKQALYDNLIKPLGLTQKLPIFDALGYTVHADPGNLENSNVASAAYGLIGMVSKAVMIVAIMFAPLLARLFGKKAVTVAGFVLIGLNSFAFYFLGPKDIGLMVLLTISASIFYGPTIPLVWAMYADAVDYSEWQTGRRATGIVFATIGFGLKAGLAIGAYALLGVQSLMDYDHHPKSPEMIQAFRVCTTIVPGALFLACVVLLVMYKLNRKLTLRMADELAERRKAVSPSPV